VYQKAVGLSEKAPEYRENALPFGLRLSRESEPFSASDMKYYVFLELSELSEVVPSEDLTIRIAPDQSPRAHQARILLFYGDWMGLLWKSPAYADKQCGSRRDLPRKADLSIVKPIF
jgi:hypothetical protein